MKICTKIAKNIWINYFFLLYLYQMALLATYT